MLPSSDCDENKNRQSVCDLLRGETNWRMVGTTGQQPENAANKGWV
jgi:hypothetical protein